MADILPFKPLKKKTSKNTMCREGHHKWVVDKQKQFDTKQGKLVTVYKCSRCNKIKNKLL